MATQNPFSDDLDKAEVWEQGYLAGFNEPETDHVLPLSPDFLDVYQQGEQGGRDDRRRQPPDASGSDPGGSGESGGHSWVSELGEHFLIHALGEGLEFVFKEVPGGLVGLVITVLTIPGDVQLHPLEPDWIGPPDTEGDVYVAVCPRTDHPMVMQSVTSDGYWFGAAQTSFAQAGADMKGHGHPEAFVARCSQPDGTCGPVWAVQ